MKPKLILTSVSVEPENFNHVISKKNFGCFLNIQVVSDGDLSSYFSKNKFDLQKFYADILSGEITISSKSDNKQEG